MLAWIRTGLALMGFGFVVARLGLFLQEFATAQGRAAMSPRPSIIVVGAVLLALGAIVNVAASIVHSRDPNARLSGALPRTIGFAAAVGIVTAMLGIGLAVYLAVA